MILEPLQALQLLYNITMQAGIPLAAHKQAEQAALIIELALKPKEEQPV